MTEISHPTNTPDDHLFLFPPVKAPSKKRFYEDAKGITAKLNAVLLAIFDDSFVQPVERQTQCAARQRK